MGAVSIPLTSGAGLSQGLNKELRIGSVLTLHFVSFVAVSTSHSFLINFSFCWAWRTRLRTFCAFSRSSPLTGVRNTLIRPLVLVMILLLPLRHPSPGFQLWSATLSFKAL